MPALIYLFSLTLFLCTPCEATATPSASVFSSSIATASYGTTVMYSTPSTIPSYAPSGTGSRTPSPSTSMSAPTLSPTVTPTPSPTKTTTVTPTPTMSRTHSATTTPTPSVTRMVPSPSISPTRTPPHSVFPSTTPTSTIIPSPTGSHTSTISPTVSHTPTVSPSMSPSASYTPSPKPVRHDCLFTPRVYNIVFSTLGSSLILYKNGDLIGGTSTRTRLGMKPSSPLSSLTKSKMPCKGRKAAVHSVWTELRAGDVLSVIAKPTGFGSFSSEPKKKGSGKSSRQVSEDKTEEAKEKEKQDYEHERKYRSTRTKTIRENILRSQNPGFILAVENVILTGRDAFYMKGIKQLIDDREGPIWNKPSFDACHWQTASIVSTQHHHIPKGKGGDSESDDNIYGTSCDSELPKSWGTDQWEFSKGARYIWGPDKLEKMVFMRTIIGENCMSPVTTSSTSTTSSMDESFRLPGGSNATSSGSTNQQQQGQGQQGGTILKQMTMAIGILIVSVAGQADIFVNGLLIRSLPPSSCRSVTQIVVPHSTALGTASFYTGAVIAIHAIVKPAPNFNSPLHFDTIVATERGPSPVIDATQGGIIVAAGPQLAMTGRDSVRVLSRKEVTALGLRTGHGKGHLWARDQLDACKWHVAKTLSVFADENKWCRPDSFGTEKWPFPKEARYMWHPDRMERDVFMRITIGGDEDKCAKRMSKRVVRLATGAQAVNHQRRWEQIYSGDKSEGVVDRIGTELVKDAEQERASRTHESINGRHYSSSDKFMNAELYLRHNLQAPPRPVITRDWACAASGKLPVLFSTPGTATLYVNGRHVATHSDQVHRRNKQGGDACETHTKVYIQAEPGAVVTFYVTGAAQASALGLVAAIGGWYVTGQDQRWRMSHARRAHNWISPGYDACHDSDEQQMIVTDMIRCKAKTLPKELDAQYVWSTTRTEFLYVRVTIGESCAL